MNFLRILLLGSFLLTGCVSFAENVSVTDNGAAKPIDSCELIYEPRPHKKAVKTVDPELILAAKGISFEEAYEFTRSILPVTHQVAVEVTAAYGKDIEITSEKIVQGGYQGVTSPSVLVQVNINNQNGYRALSDLAARIGYVYVQDSTLVTCEEVSNDSWAEITSYELKDRQGEFWNENNAALFYGLMIGALSSAEDIGYTYYPGERKFSTFVGSEEKEVMIKSVIQWLETVSNQTVDIVSEVKQLSIFFPHNDWSASTQGETYQQSFQSDAVLNNLHQHRQSYLQILNRFINTLDLD